MADLDGAIYVGVLPDFKQFRRDLPTEARKLGGDFASQFAQQYSRVLDPAMVAAVNRAVRQASSAAPPLKVSLEVEDREARGKLDRLAGERRTATVETDADTAGAQRQIDQVANDRRTAHIRVDADTSGADSSMSNLLRNLDRGIGSAGGLAGALAAIGPAAVPALAAATAGALALGAAIGGAATVSIGTGLLAFSGLGDAVKALNEQESTAARTAAQASNAQVQLASRHLAAAGATEQLRQAQAGLANAQSNAADAARAAAQRVESAEDDLRSAQERARDAQLDLTQARKDAAQQLEDLNDRLRDSALSEEEAALRVTQARERLNKVRGDSKASETDRREAELALRRAELNAEQQSKDTKRLKQEKAEADRAGIDGSKQVLAAQAKIKDAGTGVLAAEKAVADARYQQAQTARRNAYSVAQAQQAIVAAQRSIQSSALNMQRVAVPAVDKLKEAMEGLSPAGRDFARFLFGLKPGLDELRATAQAGLLPGLEDAIRTLSPLMPTLKQGIRDVAGAMADAAGIFADALVSPEMRSFLNDLFKTAPDSIRQLGVLAGKTARALAVIFEQATPAGKTLLADVVSGLGRFLDRISTPEGKKALSEFFAAGVQIVESLGGLLGGVLDVFGALAGAGSGAGAASGIEAITGALHQLADVIRENEGSGKVIAGIAAGIVGLKVIGTIAGPLSSLVSLISGLRVALGIGAAGAAAAEGGAIAGSFGGIGAALTAMTGPVGLVVLALAALAAGFYFAYTRSETFRNIVNKAIRAVGDAFVWVWEKLIRPSLKLLVLEIDLAWAVIQVTFGLFQIGLKLLGRSFMELYHKQIKPAWDLIRPLLDTFGGWLDAHVVPKIAAAARIIGGVFAGIADSWRGAFSFGIDMINRLLDVYNKVAKTFGVKPDNVHVNNPFNSGQQKSSLNLAGTGGGGGRAPTKAATGGHITGPGTGTSDDIPVWLSNGEFVIRSAAVKALGVPYLELLNQADRLGGVGGDPSQIVLGRPRYATGGLVEQTQAFIRGQDPKPYVWGAVGPGAYDCSGLVGNVWALLTGKSPYHRYFTTSSSMESLGFQRGHGTFTIGLDPGVHVVGNLGGLPFEAASPKSGIHVGSGAQSVDRLPQQWYLPQVGDQFVGGGGGAGGGDGFSIQDLASAAYQKAIKPILRFMEGLVPSAGAAGELGLGVARKVAGDVLHFDSGGWLPTGDSVVRNQTGQPEAILNPRQWRTVEKSMAGRPPININYPPHVPVEQALVDAQARADLLNF